MNLTHEDKDQFTVLSISGGLQGEDADRFRRAVLERMDARIRDFVLDLEQMDQIDSQGLEAILWLQDECAEQLGQIRLACAKDHIHTILEITRLASRFDCHDNVEAAIRSLN